MNVRLKKTPLQNQQQKKTTPAKPFANGSSSRWLNLKCGKNSKINNKCTGFKIQIYVQRK